MKEELLNRVENSEAKGENSHKQSLFCHNIFLLVFCKRVKICLLFVNKKSHTIETGVPYRY